MGVVGFVGGSWSSGRPCVWVQMDHNRQWKVGVPPCRLVVQVRLFVGDDTAESVEFGLEGA